MGAVRVNRLIENLGDFFAGHLLDEKWLISPSLRTGFQWLDWATRAGAPVLNCHVKTLQALTLDLAAPVMERGGLTFIRGMKVELLVGRAFGLLKSSGGEGYLSSLEAGPGLSRALCATLVDLRLAGQSSSGLKAGDFEVNEKGREVATLLSLYEESLSADRLCDYAGALKLAAARLREEPGALPGGTLVLIAKDSEEALRGLERALWESLPERSRVTLETDGDRGPGGDGGGPKPPATDLELLRWIESPKEAPDPRRDGTVELFRAVGEVNEVREVLRRCAAGNIPLDQVELLHTDGETYPPLIFEVVSSIRDCEWNDMPVTFAEGLPLRYSRPARALGGWLSWINEGYPQSVLVRMVQDGLLRIERPAGKGWGSTRMAAWLKSIPIGGGRERYLPAVDREIASLEEKAGARGAAGDDDAPGGEDYRQAVLLERIEGLKNLREEIRIILDVAAAFGLGQKASLEAARNFIEKNSRAVNKFDEYAAGMMLDAIIELTGFMEEAEPAGFGAEGWLSDLARTARVGGLGPRPGCLYVAPLASGGHSGRPHTFILGLDDSRFPGAGAQDPVLLDSERRSISGEMPTGGDRPAENVRRLGRLLKGLRGEVSLSYCSHSLTDDREVFPSPVLVSAFRVLSGNREGDLEDFLRWLPAPASFAPTGPENCIDEAEWWLWRICGGDTALSAQAAISENFPHLGRGMEARIARQSDAFTEYDGFVPEAGRDIDPASPDARPLSASALEKLGSCPMDYFFSYVLGIETPEEFEPAEEGWLDRQQKGSLLHGVFREFMSEVSRRGFPPRRERDGELMKAVLQSHVDYWREEVPSQDEESFERDALELERAAGIFLFEEEQSCRDTPSYFEVAIGMPAEGEGTPIDTEEPAEIILADGSRVKAKGRIDRVDLIAGSESAFCVIDYKTGSAYGYLQADPFRKGRKVQCLLYLKALQSRLDEVIPGARAELFRYFFPGVREHGERFEWSRGELETADEPLSLLCEMMRTGCFPFSDDEGDVKFSRCTEAFGDLEAAAADTKRKMAGGGDDALDTFRRLRGCGGSAGDGKGGKKNGGLR